MGSLRDCPGLGRTDVHFNGRRRTTLAADLRAGRPELSRERGRCREWRGKQRGKGIQQQGLCGHSGSAAERPRTSKIVVDRLLLMLWCDVDAVRDHCHGDTAGSAAQKDAGIGQT